MGSRGMVGWLGFPKSDGIAIGDGNYERIVIFQNFSPRMGWE
jgi:hypothetical protein